MIRAIDITKSYGGEKVLHGVSLNIAKGEFVSIMGESGSGKSTLLSILCGFLDADGGQVFFDQENICKMSESRFARLRCTRLGVVFQDYKLIPTLTVRDNIMLPALLGGGKERELEPYLADLTENLKIDHLLKKFPDELSGGQRQRAAIARSLLYKPEILVLDEPTAALDSKMEARVMAFLTKINGECGTTIVQVTHSKTVSEYGNRVIYLKDGRIV
jgi:putative ABC transport system ATP-binding protein